MDLVDYEKHIRSESAARRYILSHCRQRGKRACPRCRASKIYSLADERFRCSACKYTFHDLTGRWINAGGLSCREWLRIAKLFELDLTTHKMVSQLRLTYNTVYKAVTAIRFSLTAASFDAAQLLGGVMGRDIGFVDGKINMAKAEEKMRQVPVFGIIEKNGWVFIDLLPNMHAEHILHFNLNFSLKLTHMGKIVYTDRYQRYDALICCGGDELRSRFVDAADRTAYVDSRRGSFWNFARTRLRRYNGVSSRRFPLYLKELEFRYNNRNEDIFPILIEKLCSFVPNFDQ